MLNYSHIRMYETESTYAQFDLRILLERRSIALRIFRLENIIKQNNQTHHHMRISKLTCSNGIKIATQAKSKRLRLPSPLARFFYMML